MAITTLDQVLAGIQPSSTFFKPSATSSAGIMQSLWYGAGYPAAGSGPSSTASALLDSTTTGAIAFTNPTSGKLSYLARLMAAAAQGGTLIVYDRQAHYGFASNATATVSMSGPVTVSGQRSGAGEIWIETAAAGAAGTKAVTCSYTNQAGTTGRTSVSLSIAASPPQYSMFRLPFQSGDTGALSIASVTIGTSALTSSGTSNAIIMRRLAEIQVPSAGVGNVLDALGCGLPRIYDSSCLALMWMPAASTTGDLHGSFSVAQG